MVARYVVTSSDTPSYGSTRPRKTTQPSHSMTAGWLTAAAACTMCMAAAGGAGHATPPAAGGGETELAQLQVTTADQLQLDRQRRRRELEAPIFATEFSLSFEVTDAQFGFRVLGVWR